MFIRPNLTRTLAMPKKKPVAKQPNRIPLDEALKAAIRGSGKHLSELSVMAGLAPNAIGRYMNGRELRLQTVEAICAVLGMEFTPPKLTGKPVSTQSGRRWPVKDTEPD